MRLVFALLVLVAAGASADTVVLKNGRELEGQVERDREHGMVYVIKDKIRMAIPADQVERIVLEATPDEVWFERFMKVSKNESAAIPALVEEAYRKELEMGLELAANYLDEHHPWELLNLRSTIAVHQQVPQPRGSPQSLSQLGLEHILPGEQLEGARGRWSRRSCCGIQG